MHIWYIHPYGGGPGVGSYHRPYQLAQAWREQGHSSTIFIARHHHLLEKNVVPDPDFEVDGIRYISIPARQYNGNGAGRLLNLMDFSRNLYSAGRAFGRNAPKPDGVIASSPHPFSIFGAHRLARRHDAKLAFEIRDIWPLSITEILGASRFHPFVIMCAFAERFALSRSDLIASVLPRADQYLADRGYSDKAFVWVPNGVDMNRAPASSGYVSDEARTADTLLRTWRDEGRTTIIYTGSIGKPNAIDLLVEALAYAKTNGESEKCGVVIAGKGDQLETLKALAAGTGLTNVHFSGPLPKVDAVRLLDVADVGYAGLRNVEGLFGYGISPNKIADYFQASLPVILPIAPCGDPVSESGGGIARAADTPQAVWQALRDLIEIGPKDRRELGARGKAYIEREYDFDAIARKYVAALAKA